MNVRKFHIPLPAAVLVLLAFFLPWFSVGCQGLATQDVSGFNVARGLPELEQSLNEIIGLAGLPGINLSGLMALWLIPLVAVISVVLVALTMRREEQEQQTAVGHMIAGAVGLGVLFIGWMRARSALPPELMTMITQTQYGLWLTLLGLAGIVVGGVLSFLASRGRAGRSSSYSTGMMADPTPVLVSTSSAPVAPQESYSPTPEVGSTRMMGAPAAAAAPARGTEVLYRKGVDALAWLVVKEGAREGHNFQLSENTSIGRDPSNDIILDDTAASGEHARIKFEGGKFFLYDLASTNGVFLWDESTKNWTRIYREVLDDGRDMKIGKTVLHFMAVERQSDSTTGQ